MDDSSKYDWREDLIAFSDKYAIYMQIRMIDKLSGLYKIMFYSNTVDISHRKYIYTLSARQSITNIKTLVNMIKRDLIMQWDLDEIDFCYAPPEPLTIEEIDQCLRKFKTEGWLNATIDGPDYDNLLEGLVKGPFFTASSLRQYCMIFSK